MSKRCFDCKYSSVIKGMQSCAWESGLKSFYTKCERYEKDWGRSISVAFCFIIIFILPLIFMIYLILFGLRVI